MASLRLAFHNIKGAMTSTVPIIEEEASSTFLIFSHSNGFVQETRHE